MVKQKYVVKEHRPSGRQYYVQGLFNTMEEVTKAVNDRYEEISNGARKHISFILETVFVWEEEDGQSTS